VGSGPDPNRSVATYTNPVFRGSAPDPGVLRDGRGDYYAYTTGSLLPVLRSTDLVRWTEVGTALKQRPSWVIPSGDSHPWAPSVLRSSRACPGSAAGPCYFLYYVGLSRQDAPPTHCVGAAYSTGPAGPFTDLGPIQHLANATDASGRPPGCGDDAGYSNIDPAPFVDVDGRVYLYLATNRRCAAPAPGRECPLQPTISVIPLTDDLVHAARPRKPLFGGDAGTWEQSEAPTVENPWMVRRNDRYYLFYSGGNYLGAYGMGYATAATPMGDSGPTPFTKSPQNPILREVPGGLGPNGGSVGVLSPGGGSLVRGPQGGDWLVYHGRTGGYTEPRTLRIDRVVWNSDGTVSAGPNSEGPVSVKGPSTTPQSPVP
jgi:beta-xylosidase